MPNIFEPSDSLGAFERPAAEYQVNIDPATDIEGLATADEASEPTARSFQWPTVLFGLLLILLTFRLVNLQVTQAHVFQGLAQGNRIETRRLLPPRGLIIDRNDQSLTKNIPVYQFNLYPAQLPKQKEDRLAIYQTVETVTGIKAADIIVEVDKHGLRSIEPITLRTELDRDTALLWQTKLGFISGLIIDQQPLRSYESGLALSHILGYVGKVTDKELDQRPELTLASRVGKSGLELTYDSYLQGREGKEEMEVDSKGQIQRIVANEVPAPGKTLELYLDKELQKVMTEALVEGVRTAGRTKGAAVALDPQTGGVLGLVSLPDYDNNLFVQADKAEQRQAIFDNKDQPLFNRVIAGLYPPGSTAKPVWAVAGLQEGLITERTDIKTPTEIKIGNSTFPDWKAHGHADVKKAIAESNNIFFYALAGGYESIKGLGPNKMKEYAHRFGWNQKTKIDLPGEASGTFPDPEWKKKRIKEPWYVGDTYHIGIGQGYLSLTPLQIARSVATIANNGTLHEPRLVKTIKDLDGTVLASPGGAVERKNVADPNNLRIVREGMRRTVLEGSATPLRDIPMPIAGKTGTAQFEERDRTHAFFVGFAPFDQPSITLLVMVEGGGGSFEVAVPIAKKILTWYSQHYYEQKPI